MAATTLNERLVVVANAVRRGSAHTESFIVEQEALKKQDLEHDALAAAFESFISLGGDVDTPEAFDWARTDLVTVGRRFYGRALQGRGTQYSDLRLRTGDAKKPRKAGVVNDDLWPEAIEASTVSTSQGSAISRQIPPTESC